MKPISAKHIPRQLSLSSACIMKRQRANTMTVHDKKLSTGHKKHNSVPEKVPIGQQPIVETKQYGIAVTCCECVLCVRHPRRRAAGRWQVMRRIQEATEKALEYDNLLMRPRFFNIC